MKTIALITLILFLCCNFVQLNYAVKPEKKTTNQPQTKELRQTNDQALIFLNNLPKKNTNRRKIKFLLLNKKNNPLKKRFFEMLKKVKTKKTPVKKKPIILNLEINKFEDKNGDGINDFVANPKL